MTWDLKEVERVEFAKQRQPIDVAPRTSAPITPYRPVETVQGEFVDDIPTRPTPTPPPAATPVSRTAVSGGGTFSRPSTPTPPPSATPSGAGVGIATGIGSTVASGLTGGPGAAVVTGGQVVGGGIGSTIGGGIGGAIGSVFGPGGTVAGGAIGRGIGGAIGSGIGGAIGSGIANALGLNPPPSSNVPPWADPGGGGPSGTATYNFPSANAPYQFVVTVFADTYNRDNGTVARPGSKRITIRDRNYEVVVPVPRLGIPIAIQRATFDLSTPHETRGDFMDESGLLIVDRIFLVWRNASGQLQRDQVGEARSDATGGFTNFRPVFNGNPQSFPNKLDDRFPDGYNPSPAPVLAPPPPVPFLRPFPSPPPSPAPAPTPPPDPRPQPPPSPTPSPSPFPPPFPAPAPGPGPTPLPTPPPQPQPQPPPPPPPPPPTKTDLCQDPCIADIQRKLDKLDEKTEEKECPPPPTTKISIKIFRDCKIDPPNDEDIANYDDITIEVPQSEAANIKELHDRIFELQKTECRKPKPECIAAVPEWWQVRLGADRPQLVVQYAEVLSNGKFGAPCYALTILHYKFSLEQTTQELFPVYQKGQSMGVLTLADNSKLIVNCSSKSNAEELIEELQKTINSALLQGSHLSTGDRKGQSLKTITVAPRIAKYFADGQKDTKPTWIKHFNE